MNEVQSEVSSLLLIMGMVFTVWLVFTAISSIYQAQRDRIPCSEFANKDFQYVPMRCIKNLQLNP